MAEEAVAKAAAWMMMMRTEPRKISRDKGFVIASATPKEAISPERSL